ncbi:MAG: DUF368 domain-containing protein [Eubacteriaceae bacterium]|jgi:putative membrane protein
MFVNAFNGFSMAVADSVPGVSGGTIAFILGFYDKFINALHDAASRDKKLRDTAIAYLAKLAVGWVLGMGLSLVVLSKLFESHIYFMSSIFLGLTAASIPFIIKSEKKELTGKYKNLVFALLGFALVAGLTWFRASGSTAITINYLALGPLQYLYLLLTGMLAISAMILPGISGSTFLLILGVYVPTISAVKELLSLNFTVLPGLITLGIGILLGVAISIRFIRSALKNHRSRMIYLILGLITGSLYAIVMGPTTLTIPQVPLSFSRFSIIGFILGIAILLGLEAVRKHTEQQEQEIEDEKIETVKRRRSEKYLQIKNDHQPIR